MLPAGSGLFRDRHAAQIVEAVPEMKIGMTHAAMGDLKQNLAPSRHLRGKFEMPKGAPLDDDPGFHDERSFG